jgi:hypothetical protein
VQTHDIIYKLNIYLYFFTEKNTCKTDRGEELNGNLSGVVFVKILILDSGVEEK